MSGSGSHAGTPLSPLSFKATADGEPWGFYRSAREEGEVRWDDALGAWLVLSYDACKHVLRGDESSFPAPSVSDDYLEVSGRSKVSNLRGEAHSRSHAWWMKALSPSFMESRRPLVRDIVDASIDRFAPRGRAELTSELAARVPPRVVAAIMGLPWHDDEWIERFMAGLRIQMSWLDRQYDDADGALMRKSLAAANDMKELVLPVVRARYEHAHDDVISDLIAAGPLLLEGWGEQETLESIYAMFFSGSDTTATALPNALHVLLTDQEVLDQLSTSDPTQIARFVEEALRLYGVLHFRPRVAAEDCELGGKQIRKGDTLLVMFQAGSRDPAHYANADSVDFNRRAPRDHLAFAFGARTCVGMAVARVQLQEAITVLLSRLPDLRLDEQPAPAYRGLIFRSWGPLPVSFRAEHASPAPVPGS